MKYNYNENIKFLMEIVKFMNNKAKNLDDVVKILKKDEEYRNSQDQGFNVHRLSISELRNAMNDLLRIEDQEDMLFHCC